MRAHVPLKVLFVAELHLARNAGEGYIWRTACCGDSRAGQHGSQARALMEVAQVCRQFLGRGKLPWTQRAVRRLSHVLEQVRAADLGVVGALEGTEGTLPHGRHGGGRRQGLLALRDAQHHGRRGLAWRRLGRTQRGQAHRAQRRWR